MSIAKCPTDEVRTLGGSAVGIPEQFRDFPQRFGVPTWLALGGKVCRLVACGHSVGHSPGQSLTSRRVSPPRGPDTGLLRMGGSCGPAPGIEQEIGGSEHKRNEGGRVPLV